MLARLSRLTLPVLIVALALVAYRTLVARPQPREIALVRDEPITIAPLWNDERVVTDEQLAAVLARVKPPAGPAHTNHYVHALRLWGPHAEFGDEKIPAGRELLAYFLDDAAFRRRAGDLTPPLFSLKGEGVEVRSYDDALDHRPTSSHHADDLLATFAESGVSLATKLRLRSGEATVGDLLRTSLNRFHLEQHEYEWTAIAYGRYALPARSWRNKFGELITVDALIDELVSHAPDVGPCNGLHRLEALAVILRADEQAPALNIRSRQKALAYMRQSASALVAAQTADGYWTRQWPRGQAAAQLADKSVTLHDKLLVTGHHLEWLALAPEEVQPPRESVIRAAQWLARALVEMDEKQLLDAYGPYTHAARALSLWRGQEAWDAWQKLQTASLAASHERNLSGEFPLTALGAH